MHENLNLVDAVMLVMQRILVLTIIILTSNGLSTKKSTSRSMNPECHKCSNSHLINFLNDLLNRIKWHKNIKTFEHELKLIQDQIIRQNNPPIINDPNFDFCATGNCKPKGILSWWPQGPMVPLPYHPPLMPVFDKNDPRYHEWQFVKQNPDFNMANFLSHVQNPTYKPWTYVKDTIIRKPIMDPKQQEFLLILQYPENFNIAKYLQISSRENYRPWSFAQNVIKQKAIDPKQRELLLILQQPGNINLQEFMKIFDKNNFQYKPNKFWQVPNKQIILNKNDKNYQEFKYVIVNQLNVEEFLERIKNPQYTPWTFVFEKIVKGKFNEQKFQEFLYILRYPNRYNIEQFITIIQNQDYEPWSYVYQREREIKKNSKENFIENQSKEKFTQKQGFIEKFIKEIYVESFSKPESMENSSKEKLTENSSQSPSTITNHHLHYLLQNPKFFKIVIKKYKKMYPESKINVNPAQKIDPKIYEIAIAIYTNPDFKIDRYLTKNQQKLQIYPKISENDANYLEYNFILNNNLNVPGFQYVINKNPNYKPWSFSLNKIPKNDPKFYEFLFLIENRPKEILEFSKNLKNPNYEPWSFLFSKNSTFEPKQMEMLFILQNPTLYNYEEFLEKSKNSNYEPWSFTTIANVILQPKTAELLFIMQKMPKNLIEFWKIMTKSDYIPWSFIMKKFGIKKTDVIFNEFLFLIKSPDKYQLWEFLKMIKNPNYKPWTFLLNNPPKKWDKDDPRNSEWIYVLSNPHKYNVTKYINSKKEPWSFALTKMKKKSKNDQIYKESVFIFNHQDRYSVTEFLEKIKNENYKPWEFVKNNSGIEANDARYREWITIMRNPDQYKIEEYLQVVFEKSYKPGSFLKKLKDFENNTWIYNPERERSQKDWQELDPGSVESYVKVGEGYLKTLLNNPKFVKILNKKLIKKYKQVADIDKWQTSFNETQLLDPRIYQVVKEIYTNPKFNLYTYVTKIPGKVHVVKYSGPKIDPEKINWKYIKEHPDKFKIETLNQTDPAQKTLIVKQPIDLS